TRVGRSRRFVTVGPSLSALSRDITAGGRAELLGFRLEFSRTSRRRCMTSRFRLITSPFWYRSLSRRLSAAAPRSEDDASRRVASTDLGGEKSIVSKELLLGFSDLSAFFDGRSKVTLEMTSSFADINLVLGGGSHPQMTPAANKTANRRAIDELK